MTALNGRNCFTKNKNIENSYIPEYSDNKPTRGQEKWDGYNNKKLASKYGTHKNKYTLKLEETKYYPRVKACLYFLYHDSTCIVFGFSCTKTNSNKIVLKINQKEINQNIFPFYLMILFLYHFYFKNSNGILI